MSRGAGGSRIGAGRLGGRRLEVPAGIRPSGAKLRAALFSIWGADVQGARFLDLFAGSGAVGLEAWSRGAGAVTLVEQDRSALAAARRNRSLVPEPDAVRILAERVDAGLARLAREGAAFDLVFADPPYAEVPDGRFFAAVRAVAAAGSRLAIEHRSGVDPGESPPGWSRLSLRRYGDSSLSLYAREAD